jgi:hypothetical protein
MDLSFPRAGIDLSHAFGLQLPRPMPNGEYARTTPLGVNVRTFEPASNRGRGAARCGLSKFIPTAVVSGWVVQELATIVGTGYSPPGGGAVQTSNSGRVVTVVTVNQGNIYVANPGDVAWTTASNLTGNTPPLNFTGIMFSASNGQKLWFADGTNWVYYDPSNNTVNTWTPATSDLNGNPITSVLPVDSLGNTPRLICTWRGRTVLSGLLNDPQNWFMSAVNDPRNFDYSPLSVTPTQAVAGNASTLGLVGDVVTSLCPYTDDTLMLFGDHTIWMMQGDPMAGGTINLVSDAIGAPFGMPWCKDPYGNIYFFSNRCGVYTLVPGQQPVRISQAIEQLLQQVDTGANSIRLLWDDRFQGLHIYCTPLDAPAASTHFYFEQRSGAWWTDTFSDNNLSPLCCCVFDGNDPEDRTPLIGSWDGFVRMIDPVATTDDGRAIVSSVVLGPILTPLMDDMLLKEIQGVLGETAADVAFAIYVGRTPELALSSSPALTGTWKAGRNITKQIRRAGHAIYVKLSSSDHWAMESLRALVATKGKVRRRSRS